MRLADVKWVNISGLRGLEFWVEVNDYKIQVLDASDMGYAAKYVSFQDPEHTDMYSHSEVIGDTSLELACWLTDKEPCDAPDPHPDL